MAFRFTPPCCCCIPCNELPDEQKETSQLYTSISSADAAFKQVEGRDCQYGTLSSFFYSNQNDGNFIIATASGLSLPEDHGVFIGNFITEQETVRFEDNHLRIVNIDGVDYIRGDGLSNKSLFYGDTYYHYPEKFIGAKWKRCSYSSSEHNGYYLQRHTVSLGRVTENPELEYFPVSTAYIQWIFVRTTSPDGTSSNTYYYFDESGTATRPRINLTPAQAIEKAINGDLVEGKHSELRSVSWLGGFQSYFHYTYQIDLSNPTLTPADVQGTLVAETPWRCSYKFDTNTNTFSYPIAENDTETTHTVYYKHTETTMTVVYYEGMTASDLSTIEGACASYSQQRTASGTGLINRTVSFVKDQLYVL